MIFQRYSTVISIKQLVFQTFRTNWQHSSFWINLFRFHDIAIYWWQFFLPQCTTSLLREFTLKFCNTRRTQKTRMMGQTELEQETQLSLTNRATRLARSSRSPNMLPFHMIGMVSYYCAIVTLSIRRTVFEIFYFKDALTLKTGPWRSLKMSPFDRDPMTSYWRSIVTMALSRVVSEIINGEKYRDLEIPVRSQSMSLKVVPFDRLIIASY